MYVRGQKNVQRLWIFISVYILKDFIFGNFKIFNYRNMIYSVIFGKNNGRFGGDYIRLCIFILVHLFLKVTLLLVRARIYNIAIYLHHYNTHQKIKIWSNIRFCTLVCLMFRKIISTAMARRNLTVFHGKHASNKATKHGQRLKHIRCKLGDGKGDPLWKKKKNILTQR